MSHRFTVLDHVPLTLAGMLACLCPLVVAAVDPQPAPTVPLTCLLVEKASILIQRVEEAPFGRANVGHQIATGGHMVLAIRAWEDLTVVDSQQFWKATLELAPVPLPIPFGKVLDVPVLRSYYTYGGLIWITREAYVWGENTIRHVGLVRTATGIEAVLNGTILATAAANGERTSTTVAWRCPVEHRRVEQLGPWEGKPGTTLNSFHPANPSRPIDRPGP